jgi:MATE family multidrug resistance protein
MALPLIGAQLLQMGNGLVDAIVAGRLGRVELAAGGIGATMWFFVSLLCIGLMAGLSPTLSELIGDRRRNAVGKVFRQGLWLGLITGVFGTGCLLLMHYYLDRTALDPELIPAIRAYLITSCWSMPAMAVILAARNVCEAVNLTRPVLLVQSLGLLVNIIVDLTLGLGMFGFPKLGMYGIGLATSAVMIVMAVVLMLLLTGKRFSRYNLFASFEAPDWAQIKPLLVLSIPIFFALVFEAGLFAATGFQSGIFGTLEASAHFIAIGATAFCYMLPLGLSFALTARVGRVYGRRHMAGIRLRVLSGLVICIAMAIATAIVLLLFRHQIPAIYTNDAAVRAFAASLLLVSVIFQLSDGLQAVLLGMLRGLQDTRVPMFINAFSYWVIAFGAGYVLSRNAGWGVYGLWAGLVIGLTMSSLLLGWRLKIKLNAVARLLSSAQA